MRTHERAGHRQQWNAQQAILRRLLMKEKDYPKAVPILLSQHGMLHAAKLRAGVQWSFRDEVLSGLTSVQMRYASKSNPHSVAWKIWHMARIEDVTMNLRASQRN